MRIIMILVVLLTFLVPGAMAVEKERVIKMVVGKDGGIETADGKPLFGERFVFDGTTVELGGPGATADLRRTVFDLSDRPQEDRVITFARVLRGNGPPYTIAMDLKDIGVGFYDANRNIVDNLTRKIQKDGPFALLNLEFTRLDQVPIREVLVKVITKGSVIANMKCKTSDQPQINLSNVSQRVLDLQVTELSSHKTKSIPLGLPVLGGQPGIVRYWIPVSL